MKRRGRASAARFAVQRGFDARIDRRSALDDAQRAAAQRRAIHEHAAATGPAFEADVGADAYHVPLDPTAGVAAAQTKNVTHPQVENHVHLPGDYYRRARH